MDERDFTKICFHLELPKVTARKQACEELNEFLLQKETISFLNSKTESWKKLYNALVKCMNTDHQKCVEDSKKKLSTVCNTYNRAPKSADLFALFIRIAVKEEALNTSDLCSFLLDWLQDECKEAFRHTFFKIISDCLLLNTHIRSTLKENDWKKLFLIMKSLCCDKNVCDSEQMKCLALVIKFGPLHKFPTCLFRQQFDFIAKLCNVVTPATHKTVQESLLEVFLYFCKQTAQDNRRACCKLGENCFKSLVDIYLGSSDKMKSTLVDIFLLQLVIHNPKGVQSDHPAALAVSWDVWQNCLSDIYYILVNEITTNFNKAAKNPEFFIHENEIYQLSGNFARLFTDVSRQLFNHSVESESPPAKRQKTDVNFTGLIEKIQLGTSWPWLNLTHYLVESYPDIFTDNEYILLLEVLMSLQSDTSDKSELYHIHKTLIALLRVENSLRLSKLGTDNLWKSVIDFTLRSMNQHNEITQQLLQLLIKNKHLTSPENILQNCRVGGALTVDKHILKTVEVAFKTFTHLQSDKELKNELMQWILKSNTETFCQIEVARIFVYLVLKQWPYHCDSENKVEKSFEEMEGLFLIVCFEDLIHFDEKVRTEVENVIYVDKDLLQNFINSMTNLVKIDGKTKINKLFEILIFTFNVLSYLHQFEIVSNENIEKIFQTFKLKLTILFGNITFLKADYDEGIISKLIIHLEYLNMLFSRKINHYMEEKLRESVPEKLLQELFGILNTSFKETLASAITLKKKIIEVLINFSCLPDSNILHMQERAFKALVHYNYDFSKEGHFEFVTTLLDSLKNCKPKSLNVSNLTSVFNLLQKICESRYYCNDTAVQVLKLFYDLFPLVSASDSAECKNQFVMLLYPFYVKRESYGPELSINLLKCMSLIYELEPLNTYAKWTNDDIIFKIPEFLNSDYQQVRFTAIQAIGRLFKISSKLMVLELFHKQEVLFEKIRIMSLKVLEVVGDVDDRITDEFVSRSSSILHTFASIMISSTLWIEESIFVLLEITCDKKLDLRQVTKIIKLVSDTLNFDSSVLFLEKYLVSLVKRWKKENFANFPFQLFNCESKLELYKIYWNLLAHIFAENEETGLNKIATMKRTSPKELIKDTAPKLLSYCIAEEISDLSSIPKNKIYQFLIKNFGGSNIKEIFKEKVEETILWLISFVSDKDSFETFFDRRVVFPQLTEIHLTFDQFQRGFDFIGNTVYKVESLIAYLMHNNPEKIHHILLNLQIRINECKGLEDKLKNFHHYSYFVLLCVDNVIDSMELYLLRNLTHTLLHHIKNHRNQLELSQMSCKLLKILLQKILPSLSEVLKQFFLILINSLKYVALENCDISNLCIDMLNFLIVEHKNLFINEIEKIDSVPQIPLFENIVAVHQQVKYQNAYVTLEDEILQFLYFTKNSETIDECEHSVTHLRTLLATKKSELKCLYGNLRQTRGLSEDCEYSSLHKLISMLIVLSCSPNMKISREAARCLGELGPADLATLILQPEKTIPDTKWTPWELTLGCIASLLSKYLVDVDIAVITEASKAIFQLMSIKEGRKMIDNDAGFGVINPGFLTPFYTTNLRTVNFSLKIDGDRFKTLITDNDLWMSKQCCYRTWITQLSCSFLSVFTEREFFESFISVCRLKVELCEQILPYIVYSIINLNNATVTSIISTQIELFFNEHWSITVLKEKCDNITTNKSSVQCMLNVVHFVRLQKSVRKKVINDLKLDYLKMAKAAHFCTAHFTALLYAELWCQEQISKSLNDFALSTCSYTKLDLIYEQENEVNKNALQSILRQAYKSVGETDALLGCGTFHLLDPTTRLEHFKELNRWDLVTRHYDMEVSLKGSSILRPLVTSLKEDKLYQLSLFCSNASAESNYECLWRLGQWDHGGGDLSKVTYDKCQFEAIKALVEKEKVTFDKWLDAGRGCIVKEFVDTNMESIKNFYDTFTKLQCLNEIEEFYEASRSEEICKLLKKWKTQDDIIFNNYQYVEPVHAQRIVLLMEAFKSHQNWDMVREVTQYAIINYAECARVEGATNVAFQILGKLRFLPLTNDAVAKMKLEEAQLFLNIQDQVTAKCILKQLCSDENVNPRLHAMALRMTGKWMAESCSENRQTIIQNYFHKSLDIMKHLEKTEENEKSKLETFDRLAKFTDREYQSLMSYIKSDVFQKKVENIKKTKVAVSGIKIENATRDLQKAIMIKKKLSCIDEIEIRNIEKEKDNLLSLAVKYYLVTLKKSDLFDMTIFRLFSLLLENRNNETVNFVLERELLQIPTYKFINILPQIIPHISTISNDFFNQTINKVIEKCARCHPYHTLPLIISLAFANKDREYSESKTPPNDGRTQSAGAILSELRKDEELSLLIKKYEAVFEALIELAYFQTSSQNRTVKIPRKCKINKIRNFDNVLLPTVTLPVDKSGAYRNIVGIDSFDDMYYNVGGINAPKRIKCRGTDGITRNQLVKGQDDLRQDAVMQQVFTIMNNLLNVNKQTKNLRIKTYKIIPLSMRSGILEWVDNTIPIGEYLTEDGGGAHVKFRPMDATPSKCRLEFKNLASKSNDEKLKGFNRICEKIKPVFHKFFETSFPQPTVWYERRRTYIHSVATSSMCGYILGIGDRHVNNILIDKSTAEVVHIDFGIAFEQGKVLPTPETVPFRLTRDIVDGMGVSGVEGVFRRSCEKTVEVLRRNDQTIITILEVLLYDPLYDWTVSTAEANKRQKDEHDDCDIHESVNENNEDSGSKDVNVTAERALLRLKAKLHGAENGEATTVEHQVQTLIQKAVDPSNLSRLFYGWQPYL